MNPSANELPRESRGRRRRPSRPALLTAVVVAVAATALVLSACTYGVTVGAAPSRAAYAFEAPLPVRAAVVADGDQLYRDVIAVSGQQCENTVYQVDARDSLADSVAGTLERLVREVDLTPVQMRREEMVANGYDLVVAVRPEVFDARIAGSGFTGLEASAGLVFAVSVFTGDGLVFRESVAGNAVQAGSSWGCGEGAAILADAVEVAMENAMTDLGELIANAPGLRTTFAAGPAH